MFFGFDIAAALFAAYIASGVRSQSVAVQFEISSGTRLSKKKMLALAYVFSRKTFNGSKLWQSTARRAIKEQVQPFHEAEAAFGGLQRRPIDSPGTNRARYDFSD